MYYLATLIDREDGTNAQPGSPEFDAEVARYGAFEKQAAAAISGGVALYPMAESVHIRHSGGQALITDGPFAEQAEVIGGLYVFETENLDDVIELARQLPAAEKGAVEVRPMVMWSPYEDGGTGWWLALLWDKPDEVIAPNTPEWDTAVAEHQRFAEKVGDAIRGGGALHPPSTATTVRVREGKLMLTDGPFPEHGEVVDGLYRFAAPSRAEAIEIAAQIPRGTHGRTELRQIVDLGDW